LPYEFHAANPAAPPTVAGGAPTCGSAVVAGAPTCGSVERGTLPAGQAVELDGNVVRIHTDQPAGIQPVIDALRRRDLTIHSVRLIRQSLEDFFIETVADLHNGRPAAAGAGEGDQR
jgi:hypothetical protein